MLDTKFVYTGQSILESVQEAVRYNRYQYDFINAQIEGLKKKKGIKVLDFGAGIGTNADMFKDDTRLAIDCVEPDSQQARILKQKGYVVYKDLEDVKQRYDVIYALNVFEHIKDDAGVLTQLKSRVADEGVIVIYVPAFMLLFSKLDVAVEHYRRYRLKDMQDLLEKTGLRLQNVRYCDPIGFWAALVYRIVGGSGQLNPRAIRIFDTYFFPVSLFLEPVTKRLFGKNVLAIYTK